MSQGKKEKQDMESALITQQKDPGFWREVWQQLRLVMRLLRDPEVPFYLKIVPFFGFLYLIFPFDFVTDFAPIIGQLDDITALIVGAKVFIELAPPAVVARHLHEIRVADGYESVVEGEVVASSAVTKGEIEGNLEDVIILNPDQAELVEKEPENLIDDEDNILGDAG
ncbi:MAG: DUF1232 domain-containing protein [Chloroflexi bacterium]|nr:DUF1232 domain-containing protein [Chloroflexota bacterium]